MSGTTLFISDLHLSAERPAINALFLSFLAGEARTADALYILGDLFEFWVGDEAVDSDEYRPLIDGLRALTREVPVFVMVGNRDFLLGPGFEAASGCRLLAEPARIDLYGERVLLMHGDLLCTTDTAYLAFRSKVRAPEWQREFLAKPVAERIAIARNYREASQQANVAKKPEIMDVTQSTVEETMRRNGTRHLIHGHTHRPAQHRLVLDGQPAQRTVLGDWYEQGSVLRCTPDNCRLSALTIC